MKVRLQRLLTEASQLLEQRYKDLLHVGECIRVDQDVVDDCQRLTLHLLNNKNGADLELRVDVPDANAEQAFELGIDFLDGVVDEIFRSEREAFPPLDPTAYIFEQRTVYLSGDKRYPHLEQEADALLSRDSEENNDT